MTATQSPLYIAAKEAAKERETKRKHDDRLAQTEFVKSLVGKDHFDECLYDEKLDVWMICGVKLKCFTPHTNEFHYAPPRLPALGRWNGSSRYDFVYTLAGLGDLLE